MEKAILAGIRLPNTKKAEIEYSLAELSSLARTAGAEPVETVVQQRATRDPAYLIGQGKAAEIARLAEELNVRTIIFDEELKPIQQRNLEELIDCKIIDRTRLILDIFAQRARTREGALQVERAQLSYYLPRLTKKGLYLDSQVGGVGTRRGPGEKKLEIDQRRIRERITTLDREIDEIRKHRDVLRRKRVESGQPTVAIMGYTNSGKSTLLNTMSKGQEVYADNKLFATLDPTTRRVRLPGGREALFTDTVGFIHKLPHALVAAFRATLEETTRANCLLHVIDISNPDCEHQVQTVLEVLRELEAEGIPIISVYNKADLLSRAQQQRLRRQELQLISARTGQGVDELLGRIEEILSPRLYPHTFTLPYDAPASLARMFKLAVVKRQSYTRRGVRITLESTQENWERIKNLLTAHAEKTGKN